MHIPVLLEETVSLLDIQGNDRIFEGTLGFGGHAEALCSDLSEEGVYMGVDRDQDGIAYSKERLGTPENFYFFHGNYKAARLTNENRSIQRKLFRYCFISFSLRLYFSIYFSIRPAVSTRFCFPVK